MADSLTPDEFQSAEGVADWRPLQVGVGTTFRTGSFARGVQLINEIGRLADEANHHPDVDLRYPSVTVRLVTHDAGSVITDRDVALARQISQAARTLGIDADPAATRNG